MKRQSILKLLSSVLCIVLIAAMALFAIGCNDKTNNPASVEIVDATKTEVKTLGEGATEFDFSVVDLDGKETPFKIRTDKKMVGEALLDLELIAGEDSQYGLYVKTVNGTTLDYDTDGKYWAFYVNGEYAMSGVDTTEIKPDEVYCFKAE